jgi:glutathione S-transferase
MEEFVVHSIPGSPFGRAVLVMLEEKGAKYRLAPVAPGQHKAMPHLARHPFGKVPALEHGDFNLYETPAILRYLERLMPVPRMVPAGVREAAVMDQLLSVNECYVFQGAGNIITFQRVVGPALMGLKPDEALIEAAMPRARTAFDELARVLGEQAFFVGEEISLADVALAPQLDFFRATPEWEKLTAAHANLVAWLERMKARPSLRATTWEKVSEMAKAV